MPGRPKRSSARDVMEVDSGGKRVKAVKANTRRTSRAVKIEDEGEDELGDGYEEEQEEDGEEEEEEEEEYEVDGILDHKGSVSIALSFGTSCNWPAIWGGETTGLRLRRVNDEWMLGDRLASRPC